MGWRTALFCTRSYTRLLRPGMAFGLPGHQAIPMPLKRAFDNFETEVQALHSTSRLGCLKLDSNTSSSESQA